MDSILNSIKKMLGIESNVMDFDTDLKININSVFSILLQLGVGPSEGFKIESSEETWDQFSTDAKVVDMVKNYMYMQVRLMFDTPTNSTHVSMLQSKIAEFESRLMIGGL